MSEPQGIDISNVQGARFPWTAERGKIAFGMCKATEGLTYTDADFAGNWDSMRTLDRMMPRFAYHFLHPWQDPVAQARRFVGAVQAQGLLPGDNFVLDTEVTGGLPPAQVAAAGVSFLRCVNELAPGHRVLIYTYPSFAAAGNCAGMGAWFLWVADYGVTRPAVPAPWTAWTFWQFSSAPIDRDCFNGTPAGLLEFCRMPASR